MQSSNLTKRFLAQRLIKKGPSSSKQKRPHSQLRNLYLELIENGKLITSLDRIRTIATIFIRANIDNEDDRDRMIWNIEHIVDTTRLYDYFSNSLLTYENRQYFYRISSDKLERFKNICLDGHSKWASKLQAA